jgi:hypothetical protein
MIATDVSCGVALFQKIRPAIEGRWFVERAFAAMCKCFSTSAQDFIR